MLDKYAKRLMRRLLLSADLLKGGVSSGDDLSGLNSEDLDLSDPQAMSEVDAGSTDEDEDEAEDLGEAEAKRSRPKADKSLLPTEDRYWQLVA